MAMSDTRLGTAIFNAFESLGITAGTAITDSQRELGWQRAADEIISEQINFAEITDVSTVVAVANVIAVTPGIGVSGPGTGSGTGTASITA